MQPCQCDSQKTRNTTRLKCCACHAKWRPKCCACHENCNASSENVTKVSRLPHKTIFDTLQNTSECHEVPRLPRETKQRDVWNLQKAPLLQNLPQARPYGDRANGCGRLRTVADVNATSSEHTLNPQTPRVKLEPLLRIREKSRVSNFKTTIKSQLFPLNLHSSQNLFFGINPPLKTQYFPLNLQKQIEVFSTKSP